MPEYCELALPVPLDRTFTYAVPPGVRLQPGMRVVAPFGSRKLVGVVLGPMRAPTKLRPEEIKPIQVVLDDSPIFMEEFLRLSRWIAHYYLVPQGEVLSAMLPLQSSHRQSARVVLTERGAAELAAAEPVLTGLSEEAALLKRIGKRG